MPRLWRKQRTTGGAAIDTLGIGGAITGATLVNLGIVLLWVNQRMGVSPTTANEGMQIPAARANPLPVFTGEPDVTRPVRETISPGRSAALPDWLHQSDTSSEEDKDRERGSEDALTPRAVTRNADAHRFMAWLNSGLNDGSIHINEARAPVHFVEEGMLLVSPRIFRDYAKSQKEIAGVPAAGENARGTDVARWIQRRVQRARWHVRGNDGSNFTSYRVMLGDKGEGRLSGVLIPNPERFVSPVPPDNPLLTPFFPDNEAGA